jgi:hypothetical protein
MFIVSIFDKLKQTAKESNNRLNKGASKEEEKKFTQEEVEYNETKTKTERKQKDGNKKDR